MKASAAMFVKPPALPPLLNSSTANPPLVKTCTSRSSPRLTETLGPPFVMTILIHFHRSHDRKFKAYYA